MSVFCLPQSREKHYNTVGMLPKFKDICNRKKSIFCIFMFLCIRSFVCVGTICIHS